MCDKTSKHSHNSNEKNYKFISPSQQLDHNYKEMNAVYEEIDDCMVLNELSDFLNEKNDLEWNTDQFEIIDLTSVVKNDDISSPISSLYLLLSRLEKSLVQTLTNQICTFNQYLFLKTVNQKKQRKFILI